MTTNKVTLQRVFVASSEKMHRAFTDADAMASRLPPYGFVCKVHNRDVQVGGEYKMWFTNYSLQAVLILLVANM